MPAEIKLAWEIIGDATAPSDGDLLTDVEDFGGIGACELEGLDGGKRSEKSGDEGLGLHC